MTKFLVETRKTRRRNGEYATKEKPVIQEDACLMLMNTLATSFWES
jgi:hypothetical protein